MQKLITHLVVVVVVVVVVGLSPIASSQAASINNARSQNAVMLCPKLSLIFGSWLNNEIFVNAGHDYHSNNTHGTRLSLEPLSGYRCL